MTELGTIIKDLDSHITTFTTPFYRFAPFGYRNFVAVGNRATAIRLHDGKVLLLNPIQLEEKIKTKLNDLGGVHYIASDLGHHLYIQDYQTTWPSAKTIGVPHLPNKRKDITWDFVYGAEGQRLKPETAFGFENDIETVLFSGFITYAVAWYHKPTKTLLQSDLLMNLPCTEQYEPSSAAAGPASWAFAKNAHPYAGFFKRLIYYVASIDYTMMRRDVKKVAEWQIDRIVPCHGDVFDESCEEAWRSVYQWFLEAQTRKPLLWSVKEPFMKVMQRVFLL